MTATYIMIENAASRTARLLQGIHETAAAPAQLQQQTILMHQLDAEIPHMIRKVERLQVETAIDLKDYLKWQNSKIRRMAHTVADREHRFTEKAAEQENKYLDSAQSLENASKELASLEELRTRIKTDLPHTQRTAERNSQLQAELDVLYDSIFAGPTPEFPDEDSKEDAYNAARQHTEQLRHRLELECQMLSALRDAEQKLKAASRHLSSAYEKSPAPSWSTTSTFCLTEMCDELDSARTKVQHARLLQVQGSQGAATFDIIVPMGSMWVLDHHIRSEILVALKQLDDALVKHGVTYEEREEALEALHQQSEDAHQVADMAKLELQKARQDAFSAVLGPSWLGNELEVSTNTELTSSLLVGSEMDRAWN